MSCVTASLPGSRRLSAAQGEGVGLRSASAIDHLTDDHEGVGEDIDLRQLRHHTKNTLHRILGLISEAPGLRDTLAGQKLIEDLEHRICMSVMISDALFGLTDVPGSMAERLRELAGPLVCMLQDAGQVIRVGVSVRGCCPMRLRDTVLRSAHELIGNSVKHGMKGRPTGRIVVRLTTSQACTALMVLDNGWGFVGTPRTGGGLALTRDFAARHGGSLMLDGEDGTVAKLALPHAFCTP